MSKPKFISFESLFPRLYKIIPGIIRGQYYCVTAASGQGKSKWTKFVFVLHAYRYCKQNNIPLKIIWFAREESKEKFWSSILCDLLYERYDITITYYQLKGYHEGLTDDIESKIRLLEPEIEEMKKVIVVDDKTSNPTGIYKRVKSELEELGKFVVTGNYTNKEGIVVEKKKWVYDNPDTHVIGVVDHLGLLSTEKHEFEKVDTLHLAISKHSKYVLDEYTKVYKMAWCNVHQQEMMGENTDNRKLGTLEPSETKLGDNKLVGRDYTVTFGLFRPYRYGIESYIGYNINKLKGHFTGLILLKHRDGDNDFKYPMYFHGATNTFKELPVPFVKTSDGRTVENNLLTNFYN